MKNYTNEKFVKVLKEFHFLNYHTYSWENLTYQDILFMMSRHSEKFNSEEVENFKNLKNTENSKIFKTRFKKRKSIKDLFETEFC